MRALVLMTAAVGVTLLVFWFWREQVKGQVEPMPPLVAQLERLVEEGALGGESPESLVATLVFSEPFREADPWDLAARRRSAMQAWFGEPRELAFLSALLREPRTAGWRLESGDADELSRAEAQASAAAAWAAEKGARLRVVAHGASLLPVLRAALAAPVFERVVGVGVSLGELRPRDPGLFAALAEREPAGEWLHLYSDPAAVPRSLVLERVGPGPEARSEEVAWPGTSWVALVADIAARGRPSAPEALPTPTGAALMSARQFRSVKDGKVTTKVVDGKGHLVTGSLVVPKLGAEEIPPDPEAAEKAAAAAKGKIVVAVGDTGWTFDNGTSFAISDMACEGLTSQAGGFAAGSGYGLHDSSRGDGAHMAIFCLATPNRDFAALCGRSKGTLFRITHSGSPALLCKGAAGNLTNIKKQDAFSLRAGTREIVVTYEYLDGRRETQLDRYQKAIEALSPGKK